MRYVSLRPGSAVHVTPVGQRHEEYRPCDAFSIEGLVVIVEDHQTGRNAFPGAQVRWRTTDYAPEQEASTDEED